MLSFPHKLRGLEVQTKLPSLSPEPAFGVHRPLRIHVDWISNLEVKV